MKVWTMMRSSRLGKHPDDDSEESCDLRHLVGSTHKCRERDSRGNVQSSIRLAYGSRASRFEGLRLASARARSGYPRPRARQATPAVQLCGARMRISTRRALDMASR